jgi:membrane-bound metal-dependent hydrolase YbcI (DUF457 family)
VLALSHAASGALTGLAAAEVTHLPVTGAVTLAALTAGFVTLSDLDSVGSCAARSLGFMSKGFAYLIRSVSGGHRHATHSLVGVAVFTAVAWLACHYRGEPYGRAVLAAFLALAIAAGLRALRLGGHYADVLAIGAAAGIAWYGWYLALIPMACGLGTATHLLGDSLTDVGIPVFWPLSLRHYGLPKPIAFTTGHAVERFAVDPLIMIGLGVLAYHAVTLPGYVTY